MPAVWLYQEAYNNIKSFTKIEADLENNKRALRAHREQVVVTLDIGRTAREPTTTLAEHLQQLRDDCFLAFRKVELREISARDLSEFVKDYCRARNGVFRGIPSLRRTRTPLGTFEGGHDAEDSDNEVLRIINAPPTPSSSTPSELIRNLNNASPTESDHNWNEVEAELNREFNNAAAAAAAAPAVPTTSSGVSLDDDDDDVIMVSQDQPTNRQQQQRLVARRRRGRIEKRQKTIENNARCHLLAMSDFATSRLVHALRDMDTLVRLQTQLTMNIQNLKTTSRTMTSTPHTMGLASNVTEALKRAMDSVKEMNIEIKNKNLEIRHKRQHVNREVDAIESMSIEEDA